VGPDSLQGLPFGSEAGAATFSGLRTGRGGYWARQASLYRPARPTANGFPRPPAAVLGVEQLIAARGRREEVKTAVRERFMGIVPEEGQPTAEAAIELRGGKLSRNGS